VEELRRAVEWSDSALAHLLLGQSLAYRGRLDEGAGHLEAAAARNYVAVRHPYHAWMGFIRHRQTRLAEAVEHYEAAVRLVRDPRTMENLASIHRDMGDDARAIDLLERVLQEDAENVSVIAKLVDLYARKGETRKSRQYGERLARLQAAAPARQSRQTAKRNFELGMAAYARGDHDEALRYLNAALQAHPRSPSLLSNLGFVWFDKGDYRKALSLHEQSIAADDRHANGHYGAAQAYKALGDTDKAKQHWARYVELVPNGRFARKARQELRGAD
jgi:tetratricopeptide (TPR) repeat protein